MCLIMYCVLNLSDLKQEISLSRKWWLDKSTKLLSCLRERERGEEEREIGRGEREGRGRDRGSG